MPKRRTKKQKLTAKHQFTVSWKPRKNEAGKALSEPSVKGQFSNKTKASVKKIKIEKDSENTEQRHVLASIKKDIGKSLILAALILASEIMIYLFWY